MKILKKALSIFLLIIIILVIGYFIFSFNLINSSFNEDDFKYQYFETKDEKGILSFGSFNNSVFLYNDDFYYIDEVLFDKGIISCNDHDNDEVFKFGVIDKNTLFSSNFNCYFFNTKIFDNRKRLL